MVAGKLTKAEKKGMISDPISDVFCSLYHAPLLPKSSRFLG
jgi:hypothetical protein